MTQVLHSCVSLRSTDEGVLQLGLEYLEMISAIVSDPAVHPVGVADLLPTIRFWFFFFRLITSV